MSDSEIERLKQELEQAEIELRVLPLYEDLARAISDYFSVPNVVIPATNKKNLGTLENAQHRIIACLEQLSDIGLDPRTYKRGQDG